MKKDEIIEKIINADFEYNSELIMIYAIKGLTLTKKKKLLEILKRCQDESL